MSTTASSGASPGVSGGKDHRLPQHIVPERDIEEKPWKFIGYPGFASFLSSDDDLVYFRKFGALHSRVLLALQNDIVQLEQALDELDRGAITMQLDRHNGSFRQDNLHFQERTALISNIHEKLREYNELLLQHSQLRARPKVLSRNIDSVQTWLENKGNAIARQETLYLDHSADLVPLAPRDISPVRRLLESSSWFRTLHLWRKTAPGDSSAFNGVDENVHYMSDERVDHFVTGLVLFIGTSMLIAPIWILEVVNGPMARLGIITTFVVLFLVVVSLISAAKPFESLAAAAAYAAVLTVFLQGAQK